MSAPRHSVNPLTHSVGLNTRLVTVLQIAGSIALCVDRQGNEVRVPMYIQRAKGQLPSVGDNWLISQDFGQWAFQAFIGQQPADFLAEQITNGAIISPSAPVSPAVGDIWINSITGIWSVWDGTQWNVTSAAGGAIISPTPPPNPTVGMLWCDSSNGNIINIWDGVQWDQAPVGSNAIEAGAIVAGLIAAGAIDGFVINGTVINGGTITGGEFITSGTTGVYLVYSSGGNIVQTFKSGSGNWTAPAGVTSVFAEAWGGGGGGSAGTATGAGGGGGAGEYASQTLAVTAGNSYPYAVGGNGGPGANGVATTFTGDAATVQANPGHGGTTSAGGQGGSGSTNTTEFHGGAGSAPLTGTQVKATFKTAGSASWTVPAGVSSIKVECWGAGAGGEASVHVAGVIGGYGAGGGAYSRINSLGVVPGHAYTLTVGKGGAGGLTSGQAGNDGGSSSFGVSTCVAVGGRSSTSAGGQGGQASACTGDVKFSGGNGGSITAQGGGGGGSSAGSSAAGNNGQSGSGSLGGKGGTAPTGGGAGGNGGTNQQGGFNGSAPGGGGGGGGGLTISEPGGNGADGQVIITYNVQAGGGGGSSGGTASAGNNATTSSGAQAVSGGGPGGNGQISAAGSAPATGPGGGGGGGGINQAGSHGFTGQIRLTYTSSVPALSGSIAGAAGTDPFAGTPYPEGAKFDNLEVSSSIRVDNIATPAASASSSRVFAATGQLATVNPQGLSGIVQTAGQSSVNINTVTSATYGFLTSFSVPGGDANVIGATYKIKVGGYGVWGSTQQQLNLGIRFGSTTGSIIGVAPAISATAFAASANFQWDAELYLTAVSNPGLSNATWRANIRGTISQTDNPLLPGTAANNTVPFVGGTGPNDVTLDGSVAQTFGLSASWGSTTGAPTISKAYMQIERTA